MRILSRKELIVKAGTPADEHKVMYLSGADHFVRPRHIPVLLFYPVADSGKQALPTEVLVSSLKQLLVRFPPLSGRLRQRPNTTCKFELLCNDAGAKLVEASVDANLDVFGEFGPNRLYTQLLDPIPYVPSDIFEHPVLYAQVTRFSCGGAALVVSSLHVVTDGLSASQMITSWSEIARGVKLSNPPYLDRTLLKSIKAPDPAFRPTELRCIHNIATEAPPKSLVHWPSERMFTFSAAQLKRVKALASDADGVGVFSTFESMNAHVWRSVTKARRLNPSANTKFLTTMDARKRLNPQLPEGYFGNAVCYVSAKTTVGELVNQHLSYAAGLIRDAITGFNEDYMRSLVAFAEHNDAPVVTNVNVGKEAGHDVSTVSWVQLKFHEADFGSGKPLFAGPANNPSEGFVFMLPAPHRGDGYIDVHISLKQEHMDRLEADPQFFEEILIGC